MFLFEKQKSELPSTTTALSYFSGAKVCAFVCCGTHVTDGTKGG